MHSEPSTLQQSKEHIRILLPVSPKMRKRSNYSAEAITVSCQFDIEVYTIQVILAIGVNSLTRNLVYIFILLGDINVNESALSSAPNQLHVQVGSVFTTPSTGIPIPKDTLCSNVQVDQINKST